MRFKDELWVYPLLFLALLGNYFFPWEKLLGLSEPLQVIISAMMVSLPVLFSGIIFALSFRITRQTPSALGSNLLGAMLGGFCEYLTLVFGFQILWLVAIGFYFFSWIFRFHR